MQLIVERIQVRVWKVINISIMHLTHERIITEGEMLTCVFGDTLMCCVWLYSSCMRISITAYCTNYKHTTHRFAKFYGIYTFQTFDSLISDIDRRTTNCPLKS